MRTLFAIALSLVLISARAQVTDFTLPHLDKRNGQTQLIVNGKPFLMLAAELHNSATGSAHRMAPVWQQMADKNFNTVLAPVSWELLEPEEDKFDFTQVDNMINGARAAGVKLGILWFGSWKNGLSTYAPSWVEQDTRRFPLACFVNGQKVNMLSTLGRETMEADARAFTAMMAHIKETDYDHTVILVQVENEMGALDWAAAFWGGDNRAMRDYSPVANRAFKEKVPEALTDYLAKHRKALHPAIRQAWETNGSKRQGTWEEVFGKGQPSNDTAQWMNEYPYLTEEIFMTWHYATYVEYIASRGKQAYALPMYVNAWLKSYGFCEPGKYPSGGPLPHVFDIWRAAAPSIDIFSPDIYAIEIFDEMCRQYTAGGNPLFIPETTADAAGAARAFYAIGRYGAIGYAPFGIDRWWSINDTSYDKAFGCLKHLTPYIQSAMGTGRMTGLLIDGDGKTDRVEIGEYVISIVPHTNNQSMALAGIVTGNNSNQPKSNTAGLLAIEMGKGDFLLAGFGDMMVNIEKGSRCKADNIGFLSLDEITFTEDGEMLSHRLNGDEASMNCSSTDKVEPKVFRVKMYGY